MKHSITDGQIHQIFKHAETVGVDAITELLKRDFPDAFMQKGAWYVSDTGTVVLFSGELNKDNNFGFYQNKWRDCITVSSNTVWKRLEVPTIVSLLVNHAQTLGFMKAGGYIIFDDELNTLRYENSDFLIFNNGVWAERVKLVVKEVNKWYKHSCGILRFFENITWSIGFDSKRNGARSSNYSLNESDWIEASPLDVQFALMAYAYKNYKSGDRVKSTMFPGSDAKIRDISFEKDEVWSSSGSDGIRLFNKSQKRWAEKC